MNDEPAAVVAVGEHAAAPTTAATPSDAVARSRSGTGSRFRLGPAARSQPLLRIEDWLVAAAIAVAPVLLAGRPSQGAFGAEGSPEAVAELVAVACALVCLAARHAGAPQSRSAPGGPWIGPLTGGLLLVAGSGATALSLPSGALEACAGVAVLAMIAARFLLPPLPVAGRRLLVAPFIVVAGRLFWSVVGAVFPAPSVLAPGGFGSVAALRSLVTSPVVGFLVAFSAVYYAMLVVAPRQVAEREGGAVTWLVRYALFLAGIAVGAGWLVAFSG